MNNLVIKGIQLENINEEISKIHNTILEKYETKYIKIKTRNISIASTSCYQPSDDFIHEIFYKDNLICTLYERRNDFNTINLYISFFI